MKVIGVNGGPRKKWNTATLLSKALEGAASQGAGTETVHLYDLNFKGCISCFACKTIGGKSYGKCAVKDDLTAVLDKVEGIDAMILASPIYFGTVTGEMRSFMERLLFPYLAYTNPPATLFPRRINTGFIYTMNAPEERIGQHGGQHIGLNEMMLKMVFGTAESLMSFETYQFDDYSKVVSGLFDVEQRAKRRKEVFPVDCDQAFEMGARLAGKTAG
ncbi:MAG TPA: flavodoxin family protein [Syntrophorhabdales bacterium]|nr:flavodoxin family protein [Syntrophorhabdales bacterium]